eukprot:gene9159-1247_t
MRERENETIKKALLFQKITIALYGVSFIYNLMRLVGFIIYTPNVFMNFEKVLYNIGRIFNLIGAVPQIFSSIISIITLSFFHEIRYRALREFVLVLTISFQGIWVSISILFTIVTIAAFMSSYSNMNPSDVFILAAPTVGSFLIDVTLSFVISGAFVTFIYFLFKYDSEGFEQLEEQTEEVENMNDEITTKLQEEEEIQKDEQTKEEKKLK